MKIAIVDNDLDAVIGMTEIARAQGHEVLPLFAYNYTYEPTDVVAVKSCAEIAEKIHAFAPDLVFLDHDLGSGFDSGQYVAARLEIPLERLIGIAEINPQEYCGRRFRDKGHFENNKGYARKSFLEFLATCATT